MKIFHLVFNYLNRNLFLSALPLLLISYLLSGCAANLTRSIPVTPIHPDIIGLEPRFKNIHLGIQLFENKDAKIEGGHHEGLFQVRQPWIFGISKAQKEALYGNAGQLAALAFASELKNQGFNVTLFEDGLKPDPNGHGLLLTGKVERIVLNTYGRGTKEGFGSAGDYWEASVYFSDIVLEDNISKKVYWSGNLQSYAKLENCPAKLDWTMLTLAVRIIKGSLYLYQMQTASSTLSALSKGKSYVKNWEAEYELEAYDVSPIEVAARHASAQLLKNIRTVFP